MIEVLSLPLGPCISLPTTRKRVKLFGLSSILFLITRRPYSDAADSLAIAATLASSAACWAAFAVLDASTSGISGRFSSSQSRHCPIAWGWEITLRTSPISPERFSNHLEIRGHEHVERV